MSSFENPNVKPSFWSINVTRTSSTTEAERRLASSRPAKPAPRITTCFMGPTLRGSGGRVEISEHGQDPAVRLLAGRQPQLLEDRSHVLLDGADREHEHLRN